jgi:hypothetical protein
VLESLITNVQKFTVMALSTVHLGWLIVEEILKPPKWLIPVQGLL